MSSKVRLIFPNRPREPEDTIILDEKSMADIKFLRGKMANLIEVSGELTCQNDVRDLMLKLEWGFAFLEKQEDYFDPTIRKPRPTSKYNF